ncbi:MAG: leucine-rich repeat protein [Salinivirgaceae bacterium]|nr:leucine-rich repeat protein [Salinivirgaceae bacterium]
MKKISRNVMLAFASCMMFLTANAQESAFYDYDFNEWWTDGAASSPFEVVTGIQGTRFGGEAAKVVVPKAGNDWDVEFCNILRGNKGQEAGAQFSFECDVYWVSDSGDTADIRLLTGKIGTTGHDDWTWNADENTELVAENGFWSVHNVSRLIPKNEWTHVTWGDGLTIGEKGAEYIGIQINLDNNAGTNLGVFYFRNIVIKIGKKTTLEYFMSRRIIDGLEYEKTSSGASVAGYDNNSNITNITIPSSVIIDGIQYPVTEIKESAFSGCTSLQSVTIPESVTIIGKQAFTDCKNLATVIISNPEAVVGEYAFRNTPVADEYKYNVYPYSIDNEEFNVWYTNGSLSEKYIQLTASGAALVSVPAAGNDWDVELCNILRGNNGQEEGATFSFDCEVFWNSKSGYDSADIRLLTGTYGWGMHDDWQWSYEDNTELVTTNVGGFWGYVHNQSRKIPNNKWTHVSWGDELTIGEKGADYIGIQINLDNTAGTNIGDFYFRNIIIKIGKKTELLYFPYKTEFSANDLSYTLDKGIVTLTGYENNTNIKNVTIPETITYYGKEYPVTSIAEDAFLGCTSLSSVTIPNGITSIGNSAFQGCTSLTSVAIPDGVTSIGNSTFQGCTSLTSVTIPESVNTIALDAFSGCSNLKYNEKDDALYLGNTTNPCVALIKAKSTDITSCSIDNDCKFVASNAFSDCKNLKTVSFNTNGVGDCFAGITSIATVNIGDSVTYIGNGAFKGCTNLKSIDIPYSVKYIGSNAFDSCASLILVSIPASVEYIESSAFNNPNATIYCEWYTNPFGWTWDEYDDEYCWNDNVGTVVWGVKVYEGLIFSPSSQAVRGYIGKNKDITIPATIISSDYAYKVTSIDANVFGSCPGLRSVSIPASVTSIAASAFDGCDSIKTITVNSNAIGNCFAGQKMLDTVIIGNQVTRIDEGAFNGCSNLRALTIGHSVSIIGGYAFGKCNNLETVEIPASVSTMSNTAFNGCNNIKKLVCNSNHIGSSFAGKTSLDTIVVGNNVISIDAEAFKGCTNLCSVTIGDAVTTIGVDAFANCHNLNELNMGYSVKRIGAEAFRGCHNIKTIFVPSQATSIGADAFLYVKNVEYEGDASGEPWGALTVNGIVEGDFIYADSAKTKLTAYIGEGSHAEIPEGVTSIGQMAFFESENLNTVAMPSTVTTIGGSAFANCYNLVAVNVPKSVRSMGRGVFRECSDATIYCEAESKPNYWNNEWDYKAGTIIWGSSEVPVGINNVEASGPIIYTIGNTIVVENADAEISIYNAMGTLICRDAIHRVRLEIPVTAPGIYIVKVGGTVKRVMVY